MFFALKIIHFFALLGGGAAAIGNGILMKRVIAHEGPPPPMVANAMGVIGKIGFASILLLWITGIAMLVMNAGTNLTWLFYVKLVGAAAVLVPVTMMSIHSAGAQKSGSAPDLNYLKTMSKIARAGVGIAIIFAVLAFN